MHQKYRMAKKSLHERYYEKVVHYEKLVGESELKVIL